MKYVHWTNHEMRRLKRMHEVNRRPSEASLIAAFPRHPPRSVVTMARLNGLRVRRPNQVPFERARYWLRVAHEYFARREAGLLG